MKSKLVEICSSKFVSFLGLQQSTHLKHTAKSLWENEWPWKEFGGSNTSHWLNGKIDPADYTMRVKMKEASYHERLFIEFKLTGGPVSQIQSSCVCMYVCFVPRYGASHGTQSLSSGWPSFGGLLIVLLFSKSLGLWRASTPSHKNAMSKNSSRVEY